MVQLTGIGGQPVDCYEPAPSQYFAASCWTEQEARRYVEHNEYPQRLLDLIREKAAKETTANG